MYNRLLIIAFLCFTCITNMWAQNIMFFNSKQGLSNSGITSIYEDQRHNIWIATRNGLNRYDGVKMNVYRHNDRDDSSLLHDGTICVHQYDKNRVLIGTEAGLQIYNYENDNFEKVPYITNDGEIESLRIVRIFKIKTGTNPERIYVSTAGYGYAYIDTDNKGQIICRQSDDFDTTGLLGNIVIAHQDRQQQVWFITSDQHLCRFTTKGTKTYDKIKEPVRLCNSSTGKLYVATTSNGLYRYDRQHDSFVQVASYQDIGNVIANISCWTEGRLFLCTDGSGLRVYDEHTGRVSDSSVRVNDFDLATSNIKDALCDSHGNVWIGIMWKGVMMKPTGNSGFEYIGRHSITKNTLGTNTVFTIANNSNGNLWAAIDNDGLYLVSADGSSSTHWNKDNTPGMPSSFTAIHDMGHGDDAILGTFFEGLWQKKENSFKRLHTDINLIFDIKGHTEHSLWIATMGNGIYHYDITTGKSVNYRSRSTDGKASGIICNNYAYCLRPLGMLLFVGTADGFSVCTISSDGTVRQSVRQLLQGVSIRSFFPSNDQKHMWIATNKGLYLYNIGTRELKAYTTHDGLPVNSIKSVYERNNHLWIGTDNGLSCFDIQNETFSNYFVEDGIQDNEFSNGVVTYLNNNIYFGGISGLTYFNDKTILSRQSHDKNIKIRLVDALLKGKSVNKGTTSGNYQVLDKLLDDCATLNLSHNDNSIVIELCVDGLYSRHTTYEYSIDGSEWTNQGPNTSRISFDNLHPGKHNISIRANTFGAISSERQLTIIVHHPWYASWWAIIIYLLLLAGAAWIITDITRRKLQLRREQAEARRQEELNEARLQFIMNISHEIRTPMTLILSPLERVMGMDKDAERQRNYTIIKDNANRILRLINQMLDVRKIEQGKFFLTYQKTELVSFISNLYNVFVSNAQERNINYTFLHPDDEIIAYIDPDNIDKVVMNLLSNAFKFTSDGGSITISLKPHTSSDGSDQFVISVTDNGPGIPDTEKPKVFERFYSTHHQNGYIGTGIGLNLSALLVRLHNGTISVTDNPDDTGTSFAVHIPIGTAQLCQDTKAVAQAKHEDPVAIAENTSKDSAVTVSTKAHQTIVLVEDDTAIRQYVREELSTTYNVCEFANGQEAWDYVIANPTKANLIITDIIMPVMDGMTLCQRVKSNFNTLHIPLILMTSLGCDSDRIAGISNGADAYIAKPFNISVLLATVQTLLKNSQVVRGKYHSEQQVEQNIEKKEIESPDEQLMRRTMKMINEHLDDPDLNVELLADRIGISRVHLFRKLKELTGQSPRDFIKYIRLQEAARMLEEKKLDITGVSIATGFKSASTFSSSFKALYGVSPSEYVKKKKE